MASLLEYEQFLRELKKRNAYRESCKALLKGNLASADFVDIFATWIADQTREFCNNGKS